MHVEPDLEQTIKRGFEAVSDRFERKNDEISVLSNTLTKVGSDVEHLTKTIEKLDRHIENINLNSMRTELNSCLSEITLIKATQARNGWWVLTSLILALVSLLVFLGQVVWQKVNR